MRSRRDRPGFNEPNWSCVSVQSPLGEVLLARKLPANGARTLRSGSTTTFSRRFVPSNQRDSATKRVRWRR